MTISPAQLTTLRNDIAADGTLNTLPHTEDAADVVKDAYNEVATPDFWVWRRAITREEFLFGTSPDGTTWDFSGTGYLTRTTQELQLFESLFTRSGGIANPSITQVRTAFAAAIGGAVAPAPANRTHGLAICRRLATRFEKLFATGTGSTASPATMALEGPAQQRDVVAAWAN